MGRATQGVRIMDLSGEENVVAVARVAEGDVASEDGEDDADVDDAPDAAEPDDADTEG